ncbi:IS630 family transposase, partial [Streptomyces paromomycinus]
QHTRHPDILAAQRRERARIRSEKGVRWGGRPSPAAT